MTIERIYVPCPDCGRLIEAEGGSLITGKTLTMHCLNCGEAKQANWRGYPNVRVILEEESHYPKMEVFKISKMKPYTEEKI